MAKWFKRDKKTENQENGPETDISAEGELDELSPDFESAVDDDLDFIFEDDSGDVLDLGAGTETGDEVVAEGEGLELPPVEEVTDISLVEDEDTFIFEVEDILLAEPVEISTDEEAEIQTADIAWSPAIDLVAKTAEIAEPEPAVPETEPELFEITPEPGDIESAGVEAEFFEEEFEPAAEEPEILEAEPEPLDKKIGFFARLKERLSGTRAVLTSRVDHLLLGVREIDEDVLEELEEILITSDLGVRTTQELIRIISKKVARKELSSAEKLKQVLRDEITRMLDLPPALFDTETKPHVIMVIGVNGVGKTTTIAKLAHRFVSQGQKVMLVAADTFRAAAVEQLTIWSQRVGTDIIKQNTGADPSAVVYDALEAARARKMDTVIIDTAGRLHTKVNLMEELKKIRRVADKAMPGTPHEVLLVLDATTGQNAVNQAKIFNEAVQVNQLALTKLDGTSKGGIVVGISNELGLPIRYVGLGEAMEDLRDFEPESFVKALFD